MEFTSNPLGAGYAVHLPLFEGPIDLLLHLIERQELDITEISLMAITDQYLRAIEMLQEIEPGALADFLEVAARLLYIKSRGLLPRPPQDETEEDPSDALIQQLLEYRQFKTVANELRLREDLGLRAFVRVAPMPQMERKLDLSNLTVDKLATAVERALRRIPTDPPRPRVHTYPITVAEQIDFVRAQISGHARGNGRLSRPLRFSTLLAHSRSRLEVVVTFLAVLELVKQQEISAQQEATFGEIVLRSLL